MSNPIQSMTRAGGHALSGLFRGPAATIAVAAMLVAATTGTVLAQAAVPAAQRETLQINDEPGRVAPAAEETLKGPWARQMVYFRTNEAPGTIVINTNERFLYLVQGDNRALRYGIGVGREGFQWSGLVKIVRKAEWPDWRPPPEMLVRQPYLPRFMAGGPGNPMGARGMYLGGTVYRIHGTNQPKTIGQSVSSGCIRLTNPDVTDLYDRVPVGTRVVVQQAAAL